MELADRWLAMHLKAVVFVAFLTFVACDITNVEGVPSPADVRGRRQVAPFIVGTGEIEGLYNNVDVDAVVFSYELMAPQDFWRAVRQRAAGGGWQETADSARYVTFERFSPAQGTLNMSGSEEVRVALIGRRVLVAWVQTDHFGEPRRIRDSSEGEYASDRIWPQFEKHLSRLAG